MRKKNELTLTKGKTARAIAVFLFGALALAYVVTLNGCATMSQGKGWSEMSPKEQAANLLGVYNRQYDLYLREATSPNLTDEKREILRDKKTALVELYPYLKTYSDYAARGEFAPADVEILVMGILDRLLGI